MDKQEFNRLLANPALLSGDTLARLKEVTKKYPYFQVAWVLYLKNLKVLNDPQYDKVLEKVAVMVPNRKQLFRVLNAVAPADYSGLEYEQPAWKAPGMDLGERIDTSSGNSLIDRFLSAEPGPIKLEGQSDPNAKNDLVEKSESEHDEFITETLAMIYVGQKKYDKALDAFEKLSLKYPEKNIYFASRIEEIEKLKNT